MVKILFGVFLDSLILDHVHTAPVGFEPASQNCNKKTLGRLEISLKARWKRAVLGCETESFHHAKA